MTARHTHIAFAKILFFSVCLLPIAVSATSVEIYSLDTPPQILDAQKSTPIKTAPHTQKTSIKTYGLLTRSTQKIAPVTNGAMEKNNYDQPRVYNEMADDKLPLPAVPLSLKGSKAPVNIEADQMNHDEQSGIVSASGSVKITQGRRMLTAANVAYNAPKDAIRAKGDVVLTDESGDTYFADEIELQDNQTQAYVKNLRAAMQDGSRFTADTGRRIDGTKIVMKDATYTPCRPCGQQLLPKTETKDGYTPVWQLRAGEAVHDKEAREMRYRDAKFEVYGVPVMYAPYFFHPDGSIERKTGFLSPEAGYKSNLGFMLNGKYYYDIDQNEDATVGLMAMTKQAPLLHGEWRKRWENAQVTLAGGSTYSSRTDNVGNTRTAIDDEWRGHVLADGRWDMTDKWRSGFDVEWASDDQYMRQYDFSDEDILESRVYAERFTERNYAAGRLLTFTDTRVETDRVEQPEILPEIVASFKGAPNSMPIIGGRWGFDTSFLGLERDGSDSDMNRLSTTASWEKRFMSDTGLVTDARAAIRGDMYHVRDQQNTSDDDSFESRLVPNMHIKTAYPMAKPLGEGKNLRIEPLAALTLTPNLNENTAIPNEDSQDVQIDVHSLFSPHRYPGIDKIEDRSRITYGMRSGLYTDEGSQLTTFFGQSTRFSQDDSLFAAGSGLEDRTSDLVGQIGGVYKGRHSLNYDFQFDNNHLNARRHEIEAAANWDRFALSTRYLFAKGLAGTNLTDTREQISTGASYYLTPNWRVYSGTTHDLGEDPGLRYARFGIDHYGQCVSWSLNAERNLTDDTAGESDTEVFFRIGLKNLGEFEQSKIKVGCKITK